jgi:membrane associated rhomboid family serine protease
MIPAAVGFQCPECVKQGARQTRQNRGIYGGERSGNPRQTSLILIAANAVVFVMITLAGWVLPKVGIVQYLGLRPEGVCVPVDTANSYYPGVGQTACLSGGGHWIPGVADGAWWQVVTSMFTHVSIIHIGMNCLTLWFIGPPLEMYLGRVRFLVTYFLSGLVGSLAVYWLSGAQTLSYGASGALFGVMGALFIILWQQRGDFKQLLLWIVLNLVVTFLPAGGGLGAISWQAHLGGLVGGLAIASVWALLPRGDKRVRNQWTLIALLAVVVIIGLAARTFALGS